MGIIAWSQSLLALFLISAAAPDIVTRSIPTSSFHEVELTAEATLVIKQRTDTSVEVIGAPDLVRCISVNEENGRLKIGWAVQDEVRKNASTAATAIIVTARMKCRHKGSSENLTIRIAAPSIEKVTIRNQGVVQVLPARLPTFSASIPGRGRIAINDLQAGTTKLSIAGIGHIDASGDLGRLAISVPGFGSIDTKAAHASRIDLDVGGQGNVVAVVDGLVTGWLAGKGTISIGGRPTCAVRNSGGGQIICPATFSK